MFEVGERVVCVDDQVRDSVEGHRGDDWGVLFIRKGCIYTVSYSGACNVPGVSAVCLKEVPESPRRFSCDRPNQFSDLGYPYFSDRFRPLRKLDTSESLKALKDLTVNCPPLETAGG